MRSEYDDFTVSTNMTCENYELYLLLTNNFYYSKFSITNVSMQIISNEVNYYQDANGELGKLVKKVDGLEIAHKNIFLPQTPKDVLYQTTN